MAEKPDEKRKKWRMNGEQTDRKIWIRLKKGLEFTLGNAISRTGKTYIQKERETKNNSEQITGCQPC